MDCSTAGRLRGGPAERKRSAMPGNQTPIPSPDVNFKNIFAEDLKIIKRLLYFNEMNYFRFNDFNEE